MENRYRIVAVLAALMLAVSAWAQITSVTFKVTVDGESISMPLPASGMDVLDKSDDAISSVSFNGFEATTTGTITSVSAVGTVYKDGTTPSSDKWREIPGRQLGTDKWGLQGVSYDFVSASGDGEGVYWIEIYFKSVNGAGETSKYDNGGLNYKVKVRIGSGSGDNPITFITDDITAGIYFKIDDYPTTSDYQFYGTGARVDPMYGFNDVSSLKSLMISNIMLEFFRQQGLHVDNVSLQYKIYRKGEEGNWNGIVATDQIDVDGNKYHKRFSGAEPRVITEGLEPGMYVLECKFQIIDSDGNYYFFGDEGNMSFRFNLEAGGEPEDPMKSKLDVNDDGNVDVGDINVILEYILAH